MSFPRILVVEMIKRSKEDCELAMALVEHRDEKKKIMSVLTLLEIFKRIGNSLSTAYRLMWEDKSYSYTGITRMLHIILCFQGFELN